MNKFGRSLEGNLNVRLSDLKSVLDNGNKIVYIESPLNKKTVPTVERHFVYPNECVSDTYLQARVNSEELRSWSIVVPYNETTKEIVVGFHDKDGTLIGKNKFVKHPHVSDVWKVIGGVH